MRKPLIAGNWKMHKTVEGAEEFVLEFTEKWEKSCEREVVIAPPFTALHRLSEVLEGTEVKLGAQDVHWEKKGAYTGWISPVMLRETGCSYVIVGHSERRKYAGETDEQVAKKAKAVLSHGMAPIICVGENEAQREDRKTKEVVSHQVAKALATVEVDRLCRVVVAYEPLWAIGTGHSADAVDAGQAAYWIRERIDALFAEEAAEENLEASPGEIVRILYGGSVKPHNVRQFMEHEQIDGVLVGGASLEVRSFEALVKYG